MAQGQRQNQGQRFQQLPSAELLGNNDCPRSPQELWLAFLSREHPSSRLMFPSDFPMSYPSQQHAWTAHLGAEKWKKVAALRKDALEKAMKSCPFCNSRRVAVLQVSPEKWSAWCRSCDCTGPESDTEATAVALWAVRQGPGTPATFNLFSLSEVGYSLITADFESKLQYQKSLIDLRDEEVLKRFLSRVIEKLYTRADKLCEESPNG